MNELPKEIKNNETVYAFYRMHTNHQIKWRPLHKIS